MRPFSTMPVRPGAPAGTEDDPDDTVSYSSSDEGNGDPPFLQELAVTLIAWEPTLVAPYACLEQLAEMAPFADFLARLGEEVARRSALRGEIVGWLQALVTDEVARKRALGIVSIANGAGTALATYQAIRAANE